MLRRYSDAWFAAAGRRAAGDRAARFPRRKRALMPVRFYHGTFTPDGRRLRIGVAKGRPPLTVRLDRDVPYPAGQVRSVTVGYADGRLYAGVTAEVPVSVYPAGEEPDPSRAAGVDPGVIHPYAVAGPEGQGLLVSGRAIRAENRQHLKDAKGRSRAAARRAPKPGQRGSRRWRKHRRGQKKAEARHQRRVRQARHEAAREVVDRGVRPGRRDPSRRPSSRPRQRHLAGSGPPPAPPPGGTGGVARGNHREEHSNPRKPPGNTEQLH